MHSRRIWFAIIEIKAGIKRIFDDSVIKLPLRILVCLHHIKPILGDEDGVVFGGFGRGSAVHIYLSFEGAPAISRINQRGVAAAIPTWAGPCRRNDDVSPAGVINDQTTAIIFNTAGAEFGSDIFFGVVVIGIAVAQIVIFQRNVAMIVNTVDDLWWHVICWRRSRLPVLIGTVVVIMIDACCRAKRQQDRTDYLHCIHHVIFFRSAVVTKGAYAPLWIRASSARRCCSLTVSGSRPGGLAGTSSFPSAK